MPLLSTRRELLLASGVGLLTFTLEGCARQMTPREAQQRGADLAVLTSQEAELVRALGEVLAPGSGEAGLAHYLDHQLGAGAARSMLMIKYLGVEPPFTSFYRDGLRALEDATRARFGQTFVTLDAARARALVEDIAAGRSENWAGPPAAFFYFVLRNDACDVLYGTQQGFSELGVPYLAHIEPPTPWGA